MTDRNHLASQTKNQSTNTDWGKSTRGDEQPTKGFKGNRINRRNNAKGNLKLGTNSNFNLNPSSNNHQNSSTKLERDRFQPDEDLHLESKKRCTSGLENLSILDRAVARSGLSYDTFVRALIGSALSRLVIWDQTDVDRLLLTAEKLNLDPLCGEIYAVDASSGADAFQNQNKGKKAIVIVVSVDGWSRIINSHSQFDGMKFFESEPGHDELPLYFECTIFRKDRRVATSVREYMYEAHTGQGAWLTHPRRMLRHKAMVQCARICFGLGGVYEPDEALRVTQALQKRNLHNINGPINTQTTTPKENTTDSPDNGLDGENSQTERSSQRGGQFVKDWVLRRQA
jgi:phage recombination protein Bet